MAKEYYQILGVSKSASQEEIKRAYRKLAHEYHPDKNKDHTDGQRFKEINEAYQVLSNPRKRAQYDQFGFTDGAGFNWGGADQDFRDSGGFSRGSWDFGFGGGLNDIFEDFFGGVFSQVQTEVEINLTSALLGDILNLQTSQGEQITLSIPAGTQDGQTFRFAGKGMSTKRGRGDLLITVRIKMPRHISREQRELLEQLKNSGM